MKIIIIGPPASGKGTIAKKLAQNFNLKHISPGAILREEINKNTTIGQDIKKYIENGQMVPNKFVVEVAKLEMNDNFILDGFPRNIKQAKDIKNIDQVINLKVPDDVIKERISGRRICPNCGKEYHLKYIPPKKDNLCDVCKTKLERRKDDKPEIVKKRLKQYHENNSSIVEFYKDKVKNIDGDQTPEKVYQQVVTTLRY